MAPKEPLDLRLVPGAVAGWGAAALGLGWTPARTAVVALALLAAGIGLTARRVRRSGPQVHALVAIFLIAGGAFGSAALRADAIQAGPIGSLAVAGATVHVSGRVTSDPVRKQGTFAPYVLVSLSVDTVSARGDTTSGRSPVLVIGGLGWLEVAYGDRISAVGRLQPADGPDLSAVIIAPVSPTVTTRAGWVYQAIASVRSGLREAAAPLGAPERALLPALVDGDDSSMPEQTTADFKATGLTHLLAVSGSNLTLVLGFVLSVARWVRVRGYWLGAVGVLAVIFFVLLARPQPSVLRAAAMGVVALAGLSSGSRARGIRVLCVAVVVLVIADPWLARSVGFLLSTLASAGILVLAPQWRDLLARWMPRWLAEAIAVPMAAQLVCTPVIAAIAGQVSLVAVLANMAVAPAVGPATVASLLAGLLAMIDVRLGQLAGRVAGVALWWVVWIAGHGAKVAGASIGWGADLASVAVLAGLCTVLILALPFVLPRRLPCLAASGVLVLALLHPIGRLGWPPEGWVMVMCDVGQGDGLVLNAGQGVAVVVDTGPDPALMQGCLDDLAVRQVALVVLTHFHADHVDGLPAVLAGWPVGEITTSPYHEPSDRYSAVLGEAGAGGVPVTDAAAGERRRIGQLSWRVIGPLPATADGSGLDDGSGPNNASVVMVVEVGGIAILLGGDAETEEVDALLASGADLKVDVLKEPHHGSAALDPRFLAATHAAVSLISVGAGNLYGHPSPQILSQLQRQGTTVYRTDQDGDIVVVVHEGHLSIVTAH